MSDSKEVFPGVTGPDLAALGLVLAICSPWIAAIALGKWSEVSQWCADHGVLVAEDEDPLLTLPRADGAGFDTPRLVIAAVAVITLIAVVLYARTRWRAHRRRRQMARMVQGVERY